MGLDQVTARHALVIGLAQVLALWPGVSRSLVTIVAGCLVGLTLPAAVELSFLLGFVVLLAASGLELCSHGGGILAAYGWAGPLLGLGVAFVSAVAAIRWLPRVVSGRPGRVRVVPVGRRRRHARPGWRGTHLSAHPADSATVLETVQRPAGTKA